MQKYPLISVVVPTYNSERTLDKNLRSIRKQTYPQAFVEIIIVDGGSKDSTLRIAKQYKCRILKNPKMLQVYAKHLGYLKAKGKYVVHLDSDEVLKSSKSLMRKYKLFDSNKRIKAVLVSGLLTPRGSSAINHFINEFGDPFSYFLYRNSTYDKFFRYALARFGKIIKTSNLGITLSFSDSKRLPLLELSAMGFMLDREYLYKNFPQLKAEPFLISHVFYMLVEKKCFIGIVNNDPVLHYSASTFLNYIKKLRSRVVNNVFTNDMGLSALAGRAKYYPKTEIFKKLLFFPYTILFFPCFIDGLYLTITRRKIIFLLYPFICFYLCAIIVYYFSLKLLKISPPQRPWGM